MHAMYRRRAGLLAAMLAGSLLLGCELVLGLHDLTPYPPDGGTASSGGPAPISVMGTFIGGFAQGSKAGIELHGQLLWHGVARGTKNGVTLEGSIE